MAGTSYKGSAIESVDQFIDSDGPIFIGSNSGSKRGSRIGILPFIGRRKSGDACQLSLIDQVLINLFQIPAFWRLIQANYRY